MNHFSTLWYYQNAFISLEANLGALADYNKGIPSKVVDSVSWESTFASSQKIVIELTDSIFNVNLSDMIANFGEVFDTMVQGDIDEHLGEAYLILAISLGIFGLVLGYTIWAACISARILKGYVETYALLKPWELHASLEELQKMATTFERFLLNELYLVSQYLEFFHTMYFTSVSSKLANLQEKYSREKVSTKFKRDAGFISVKLLFGGIFMILLMFGLLGLTVLMVVRGNDNRLGMQFLIVDAHQLMTNVTKNYFGSVIYS